MLARTPCPEYGPIVPTASSPSTKFQKPPRDFIRKIFSNHWKTAENFFQSLEKPGHFFQPLEKFFPIIGKLGAFFPTIGKKFSNHWKIRGGADGAVT
jgi:hypothetical protein